VAQVKTDSVLVNVVSKRLNILSSIKFYFEHVDVDGMIICCFLNIVVVTSSQPYAHSFLQVSIQETMPLLLIPSVSN
jgi:hypothetical protein